MKKFRKVIPALCMLLVSAIMLGSTTYAWFSMNNKVTASNMQVTAKSNTQFLIISTESNLSNVTGTSAALSTHTGGINNTTNVYPCAKADKTFAQTHSDKEISEGDWYTANSNAYDKVGTEEGASLINIQKITELTNYQLSYTFYIGLAAGSDDYTGALTFSAGTSNTTSDALRAIVKVGDQELTYSSENNNWTTSNNVTLKANEATTVTVTLYIDGNHSSVKSKDFQSISGNLNFDITANGITIG